MHYSRELENICITLRQIYSRQYVQNFIRIGQILYMMRGNILVNSLTKCERLHCRRLIPNLLMC